MRGGTILADRQIDRWNYIDLIEFLGMLFVLIYHSTTYSYSFVKEGSSIYYARYFMRTILSTCVPLFFFSNGFLLLNKPLNIKKHIIKIINIIILTGVWGIISILILMPIEHECLSMKEIIVYLCTWHQGWINHLWYMGALVCIYVFFPILKCAFDNQKKSFLFFTAICAIFTFGNRMLSIVGTIFASAICGKEVNFLGINLFNMFNPFRGIYGYAFVYFCVGGLAYGYTEKLKRIKARKRNSLAAMSIILSCTGLFVLGVVLSNISGKIWDVVWDGYDTIFTFVNVSAIFVLSISYLNVKNKAINKIVFTISCNTLGIYHIHGIFIHLTHPIVKEWIVAQTYLGCVAYSIVIMMLSLCAVLVIKKIPVLDCLVDLRKLEKRICK